MIRFSRMRRNDPLVNPNDRDSGGVACGRAQPRLGPEEAPPLEREDVLMGIGVDAALDTVPDYEERKRIMANDPLDVQLPYRFPVTLDTHSSVCAAMRQSRAAEREGGEEDE